MPKCTAVRSAYSSGVNTCVTTAAASPNHARLIRTASVKPTIPSGRGYGGDERNHPRPECRDHLHPRTPASILATISHNCKWWRRRHLSAGSRRLQVPHRRSGRFNAPAPLYRSTTPRPTNTRLISTTTTPRRPVIRQQRPAITTPLPSVIPVYLTNPQSLRPQQPALNH